MDEEEREPTGVPEFTREDFVRLKQAQAIFRFVAAQLPKCNGLDMECQYFHDETARGIRDLDQIERYFFSDSGWTVNPGEVQDPASFGPALTDRQFEQLKTAERKLHDLLPLFDKIEACGQDCNPFRAKMAKAAHRLSLIERNFFMPAKVG